MKSILQPAGSQQLEKAHEEERRPSAVNNNNNIQNNNKKERAIKKRERDRERKVRLSGLSTHLYSRIILACFCNHHVCKQDSLTGHVLVSTRTSLWVRSLRTSTSTCSNTALWGFIIPGLTSVPFWFHRPCLNALSDQCWATDWWLKPTSWRCFHSVYEKTLLQRGQISRKDVTSSSYLTTAVCLLLNWHQCYTIIKFPLHHEQKAWNYTSLLYRVPG